MKRLGGKRFTGDGWRDTIPVGKIPATWDAQEEALESFGYEWEFDSEDDEFFMAEMYNVTPLINPLKEWKDYTKRLRVL